MITRNGFHQPNGTRIALAMDTPGGVINRRCGGLLHVGLLLFSTISRYLLAQAGEINRSHDFIVDKANLFP